MIHFTLKSIRLFTVLSSFLLLCNPSAWGDVIYSTAFVASPDEASVSTSSCSNNSIPSWATGYSNCYRTSGSSGYYNITFSSDLDLSDYTDVTITVHWGSPSKRPLKISVNGATATTIYTITDAEKSSVLVHSADITVSSLTSLRFSSSGGGDVYFFDFSITGTSTTPPVPTPPATKTLYLKPGTNWTSDGARFAVYCFGNGDEWVDMEQVDAGCSSGTVYKAEVDAKYPNCIFGRMNPGTTENNFNDGVKWNKTGDLNMPTAEAGIYEVPDGQWDNGDNTQWKNQPLNLCVTGSWLCFVGEQLTLTATSIGATHYQWYKGGTAEGNKIDGATTETYINDHFAYEDAGDYYCKTRMGDGSELTSSKLTVKTLRLYFNVGRGGDFYKYVDLKNTYPGEKRATGMLFLGKGWDYAFSVADGCGNYYGQNNDPTYGAMHSGNCTDWPMNSDQQCCIRTENGATYTFIVDYTNFTLPLVSVNYPPDNQAAGKMIYFDNSLVKWNDLYYRVGRGDRSDPANNHTQASLISKVPGTAYLYQYETVKYDDLDEWHITSNCGWTGNGRNIYQTNTNDEYAIALSSNYEGGATTQDVTLIPTGSYSTGNRDINNNCEYYAFDMMLGMKTQNVTIDDTENGSITVSYIDVNDNPQSFNSGNRDLAHTCILTIATTPECGYRLSSLTVNGAPFMEGDTYILSSTTAIDAEFEAYNPITYNTDGGTINDIDYPTSYVLGVGATLPTDVTNDDGDDFLGWYDNAGFLGEPVTNVSTTDCGPKEFWAKWSSNPSPVFTWTYDATVKAGGVYPITVSSTGDADVTLTIVETIVGVTGAFTAGNPATGTATIGVYPSATTFTYRASSPASANFKTKTETKTVTIEKCETPYNLAYGVGYTDAGSSAHPRYFHETSGVGLITKGNGGSGNAGNDASWSGEDWIVKSNKNGSHLLQTYLDNVVKIEFYVMAGGNNVTITKLRRSSSHISSDSGGDDALPGTTIIYNNNPSNTGLTKNEQQIATIIFTNPLDANEFLMLGFSTSSTLYGVKLFRAEGDEPTSVAFSGELSLNKFVGDAPFTKTAVQTSSPVQSGGAITYSSSDETVATVDKNTGEVTIVGEGRARIIATLKAFGCFKEATAEYVLIVKPCTDRECTVSVTAGTAAKCPAQSVTLTATADEGASFQWFKDGVALSGETNASLTVTEEGDYYAEARKACMQRSNTITVSNLTAPTAVSLHEFYYIKAGREMPDIPMFQLENASSFTTDHPAPAGCEYVLREDGIVYLVGTPDPGLSTEDYVLTVSAHNECGFVDATATLHLYSLEATPKPRIAWVVDGTKNQTLPGSVDAAKSTSHVLYQYLEDYFILQPVNAYCTIDTKKIKDYYSQFDLVLLTDYPDSHVCPDGMSGDANSYSNAIGCLIDEKPILTFEAFVAGLPNWGINTTPGPKTPTERTITLLCAAHNIFDHTIPVNDEIEFVTSSGLQGFAGTEAPPGTIYIATIPDGSGGTRITCCERQKVVEARMMIMGLNHNAMASVTNYGKIIIKQIIDYLLQTKNIADCALVFDDANNTHVWSDPKNWAPAHNVLPKPFQATRIEKDCYVDVTDAHCASVRLRKGHDGGQSYDAHLFIRPNGGLTVSNFISVVRDANFMTTYPIATTDLRIEADEDGNNGTLVYGNKEEPLAAQVEYYSIGTDARTSNPIWQYMGIPISDRPEAIRQYYAAWMCSWESVGNVTSNWVWVENEDKIVPFKGYCITQESKCQYLHSGLLNLPKKVELPLHYFTSPDGDGFNMFANSWVAPIDIANLKISDFNSAAEPTIFIFNTGSYSQAAGVAQSDDGTATAPGQYNAIPVNSAPYMTGALTKIPTMQGFFVQATKTGTLTLDYRRLCYDTINFVTTTQRMRAPRRFAAENEEETPEVEEKIVPQVMRLDIRSASSADRLYIMTHDQFSEAFDRGWDGSKQEGDASVPMLAFVEGNRLLAVAAVKSAEGRYLCFRAGKDSEYTFHFDYEGETIYLYDQFTQQAAEIRTGNTYTFTASNKTPLNRFLITATPPRVPTDNGSVEAEGTSSKPMKYIYDGNVYIYYRGAIHDVTGREMTPQSRKEAAQ